MSVVLPSVVQTRQKGERFLFKTLPVTGLLPAAGNVLSNVIRSNGYVAVVGLFVSNVAGTLVIQGAPEIFRGGRRAPGTFVPLETIATAALGGFQVAEVDFQVRADYVRLSYTNGPANQSLFQPGVQLVPIYAWKQVSIDPTSPVPVVGSPGTDLESPADTPVAAAATVPLTVPPAGTRRMTVEVTGGSALTVIRVRELGGIAGAGRLLNLGDSTMYGGLDGAIAPLEAQNVAGPDALVHIDFEG